ncbi:FadR/GntR family transcriptional regulator [Streptomyces sp. JNUCC 63]
MPRPSDPSPTAGSAADSADLDAFLLSGVRRLSALDAVRARIALAVDLGLLAPGERLPGSDRIAQSLGVSEITARRALVSLCEDGVLERRRGRNGGTLVAEQPARGVVGATDAYLSAAPDVHRLIDHRLVLECGIAHLAAENAGAADVRRLERLVEDMEQVPSWAEFHSCDERFHLAVAEAAGLPTTVASYGVVLRELYQYYLPYPLEPLRNSNSEHRDLVEAVAAGDCAGAARIARQHVETLRRTMFVGLVENAEPAPPRG